MDNLEKVFNQFRVTGTYKSGDPYGSGHIHDTFRVITVEEDRHDYILQKLNNKIFKDIDALQNNISIVTSHIREKLVQEGEEDIDRKVLQLIKTHEGKTYYVDGNGSNWRMYIFISKHVSYDIVENEHQAYQGGKAIGRFQSLLSNLDSTLLTETIPYFHDIERRLDSFYKTVKRNPADRVKYCRNEIEFVDSHAKEMGLILKLGREGKIPLRTTHNDTKFNNVLLDLDNNALCVIDLDTVMPGYVHYDFGDAIRTVANCSSEDEKDLSKVVMDIKLFEAYADGYLSETSNTLNSTELAHLAFAPKLVTFTIGLRFLTDYIDGDNYFKVHREGHNLDRARTQFKLVESNEEQYEEMKTIIERLISRHKN